MKVVLILSCVVDVLQIQMIKQQQYPQSGFDTVKKHIGLTFNLNKILKKRGVIFFPNTLHLQWL